MSRKLEFAKTTKRAKLMGREAVATDFVGPKKTTPRHGKVKRLVPVKQTGGQAKKSDSNGDE